LAACWIVVIVAAVLGLGAGAVQSVTVA
jgi:hypothetical protein